MESIKCTKYGCKSTSFRTMADNGSTVTLKCNVCGTVFQTSKTKNSTASQNHGRAVYGDRHSYDTFLSSDDDDTFSSRNNDDSFSSSSSSSNDDFGSGSSDGGGGSDDW